MKLSSPSELLEDFNDRILPFFEEYWPYIVGGIALILVYTIYQILF